MAPSVDDMLRYCRDELASRSVSSSAAVSCRQDPASVAECSWRVSTVSDTELQPPWVCPFDPCLPQCERFLS